MAELVAELAFAELLASGDVWPSLGAAANRSGACKCEWRVEEVVQLQMGRPWVHSAAIARLEETVELTQGVAEGRTGCSGVILSPTENKR